MSEMDLERHSKVKCSDSSPYPEIKVKCANIYYAELLMEDYAGAESELSAINQYIYHHYFAEKIKSSLGELLHQIAIVEMKHLEILADLIIKLGGNPIYRGSCSTCGNYWNAGYVKYGMTVCEQLKADIDHEYVAIRNYENHIKMICDPCIEAILKRIILDEKIHIKLLNEALKDYCKCDCYCRVDE